MCRRETTPKATAMKHQVLPKISAESIILPVFVYEYKKAKIIDTGNMVYLTG
jgi:hypothetical protein